MNDEHIGQEQIANWYIFWVTYLNHRVKKIVWSQIPSFNFNNKQMQLNTHKWSKTEQGIN